MEKLLDDMQSAEGRVNELKSEVTKLESSVIERKRKRNSSFPSVSSVSLTLLRLNFLNGILLLMIWT